MEAGRAPPAPVRRRQRGRTMDSGCTRRLPLPCASRCGRGGRAPCPPRHPGPAAALASTRSPGPTEMPQSQIPLRGDDLRHLSLGLTALSTPGATPDTSSSSTKANEEPSGCPDSAPAPNTPRRRRGAQPPPRGHCPCCPNGIHFVVSPSSAHPRHSHLAPDLHFLHPTGSTPRLAAPAATRRPPARDPVTRPPRAPRRGRRGEAAAGLS